MSGADAAPGTPNLAALVEVIGRVIGRQGRTAQAVRGLVSLAAEKTGAKAQVEFRERR